MNPIFPKQIKINVFLITILTFLLNIEAQSQSQPQITCPDENVVNICAPVGVPIASKFEDFNPSDDNTAASEIDFKVTQTIDKQPDFNVVTYLYTFTDKDGNSSTCETVYNVLTRFVQAPKISEQRPICSGNLFAGVKLGGQNYRVYADDNGSQGELLGLCDNADNLCTADIFGIDVLTVASNQLWVSHFVTFPDGSICESAVSSLQIEVLEKPEAKLKTSNFYLYPYEVINLMDLVEENTTGYWTGDNVTSFATAEGETTWTYTSIETIPTKLFYTVKNGSCSQSYSLVAEVLSFPSEYGDVYYYGASDFDITGSPGGTTGGTTGGTSGGTIGGDPTEPQPNAGLVTAAEWSDLNNWEFLDTLLNENDYYEMPEYWGFYPKYRVSVLVKTTDNIPVVDAEIELLDANNVVSWAAKTDNKGTAELWPTLYTNDTIDISTYNISVNGEAIRGAVMLHQDGINEIVVTNRPANLNLVELSFIVDATGSMADELEFLKQDLRNVITTVEDTIANLDIYTSTVFYRDEGDEYLVRQSDFTNDIDETISFIQNQYAAGGGDFPEAVHTALDVGINNLQWSANAKARIAFLLLDAPPHYTDAVTSDIQNTIKTAAAKGIKVIPLTASGIDKETEFLMRFIAMATNGTYTFITNDSGIGNDHIEPSIGDFDVEYLNNLLVRLILQYTN